MAPRQKTVLTIVIGAIVAITPSFFSYLEARQEIREKYGQSHDEAASGHDALASSVSELQKTVLEQHDYVVKLEGQVEALTRVVTQLAASTGRALPTLDKPPGRPRLAAPPNFEAAAAKR